MKLPFVQMRPITQMRMTQQLLAEVSPDWMSRVASAPCTRVAALLLRGFMDCAQTVIVAFGCPLWWPIASRRSRIITFRFPNAMRRFLELSSRGEL